MSISGNALDMRVRGYFAFGDWRTCEQVAYLAVELEKGDSPEVAPTDWQLSDNDMRYTPYTLRCMQGQCMHAIHSEVYVVLDTFRMAYSCIGYAKIS